MTSHVIYLRTWHEHQLITLFLVNKATPRLKVTRMREVLEKRGKVNTNATD